MDGWIDSELAAYEKLDEAAKIAWLKFESGKVKTIEIDFSAPFEKKEDKFGKLQAHIPVKEGNEMKTWGLNIANPFYREILKEGKRGNKVLKIVQTGKGQDTRYSIVE